MCCFLASRRDSVSGASRNVPQSFPGRSLQKSGLFSPPTHRPGGCCFRRGVSGLASVKAAHGKNMCVIAGRQSSCLQSGARPESSWGWSGIPGHGCALWRDVPRPGHRRALLRSLAHAPGEALFLVAPKLSLCSPALSKARPPDPVPPAGRAFLSSGHSTEAVPYFPETCCLPPGAWPCCRGAV